MSRIPTPTTNVDRRPTERLIEQWSNPVVKVAIRRITPQFRRDHEGIPGVARWAAVAYLMDGRCVVWLTDADEGVGCLVTTARTLATQDDVRFVEPDATCPWCGSPIDTIDAERAFCAPTPSRDCEALYRGRETTWRERNVQPRRPVESSAAWAVSSRDLDKDRAVA